MVRSRATWLGVLALAILGGLVYLFLQVTADPAPIEAAPATASRGDHVATERAQPEPGGARIPGPRAPMTSAGPARVSGPATGSGQPASAPGGDDDDVPVQPTSPDVDLDRAMDEANKLYDNQEYEGALKQALRVLEKQPEAVRMLRIVVSSACLMGDGDMANKFLDRLPARDQADMVKRCERSEIRLTPTKPLPGPRGLAPAPLK